MADGAPTATAPKFAKIKPPAGAKKDATATLHVASDPLESIYIYADELLEPAKSELEKKQSGTVTFVTVGGAKAAARLIKTWFPAGVWQLDLDGAGNIKTFKPLEPKVVPQPTIDVINSHNGQQDFLIQWQETPANAKDIARALAGARNISIRLVVSYSKAKGGNSRSLADKLDLTSSDKSPLADPVLAQMYLEFVQHFGRVDVDFNLAKDGLTRPELDQVEQNRPAIIAITDLFLQGFGEFKGAKDAAKPPAGLDEFRAMEEAIFYQRRVKNDLALRNMLMIGMGTLIFHKEDGSRGFKPDIGILRRTVNAGDRMLLYDRFGNPVRSIVGGFQDSEFRSTDVEKVNKDAGIPTLSLEVSDETLYRFLRSLEQSLGHPVREIEALTVSYYKFAVYINAEIFRRYNGEIGKRFVDIVPLVLAFFVAHAFIAFLVRVQPSIGIPLMLLLKGGGMLLGFDAALLDMELLATAGRHFTQMEQLSREEKGKTPELTRLSDTHLKQGAAALLDAMADIFVGGVLLVGTIAGVKFGPAILRGIKNQAQARIRMKLEKGKAVEIEAVKPAKEVKAPAPKQDPDIKPKGLGNDKPPADVPKETKPIEQPDAYKGDPIEGKTPKPVPFEPKRPRALDQSPEEFIKDTPEQKSVQRELFERSKEVVARQDKFIQDLLAELKIKGADAKSILKRDVFEDFTRKIAEKVGERKKSKYKTVGQMTDIVRGRINLDTEAQVEAVVKALVEPGRANVAEVRGPRTQLGVKNGYPRAHVDIVDPETGMTHEWQIGTKQTTRLYQEPGIDVHGVKIDPANRNIHDVEYDIFKSLHEPDETLPPETQEAFRKLAAETGIPEFRKKVAEMSARSGKGDVPESELAKGIQELHKEASRIMRDLVDKKGAPFLDELVH